MKNIITDKATGISMNNSSTKKMQDSFNYTGFAASVPGAGHIRFGIPCQDASATVLSPRPAAIVCDGRGSAKLSHFGAQGAVKAFVSQISILEPFLAGILDTESPEEKWQNICRLLYRTLFQVKLDLAAEHECNEKEFDFTVAFVIAGKRRIGCFQVGDGSIVLRQDGKCKTAFLPDKGEFANQTCFLREGGEIAGKFQAALFPADCNSGFALTSDGPEHLMFHLPDMVPGEIFNEMLIALSKGECCRQDIMDYLTRSTWNKDPRGNDDRSLALMCSLDSVSACTTAEQSDEGPMSTAIMPEDSIKQISKEAPAIESTSASEVKSEAVTQDTDDTAFPAESIEEASAEDDVSADNEARLNEEEVANAVHDDELSTPAIKDSESSCNCESSGKAKILLVIAVVILLIVGTVLGVQNHSLHAENRCLIVRVEEIQAEVVELKQSSSEAYNSLKSLQSERKAIDGQVAELKKRLESAISKKELAQKNGVHSAEDKQKCDQRSSGAELIKSSHVEVRKKD